jgi:hypothetical protein
MRFCAFPDRRGAFVDSLQALQTHILENNVKLIVVDSIAALARMVTPTMCLRASII